MTEIQAYVIVLIMYFTGIYLIHISWPYKGTMLKEILSIIGGVTGSVLFVVSILIGVGVYHGS